MVLILSLLVHEVRRISQCLLPLLQPLQSILTLNLSLHNECVLFIESLLSFLKSLCLINDMIVPIPDSHLLVMDQLIALHNVQLLLLDSKSCNFAIVKDVTISLLTQAHKGIWVNILKELLIFCQLSFHPLKCI